VSEQSRIQLSLAEARGVMLAAQGLFDPSRQKADLEAVAGLVDRLGAVQIDTISVVERSQYVVLWSRLGAYEPTLLDTLLSPRRAIFEYWSHAASIVPMTDYVYYRPDMLRAAQEHPWGSVREWLTNGHDAMSETLEAIRERGPLASADFERDPAAPRTPVWDWYGPKESRRALEVLWTSGHLMVHSRRGGQKVYDLRERVLAEAFGNAIPSDDELPTAEDQLRHFTRRTVRALGVLTPSWLWDYFRMRLYLRLVNDGQKASAVTSRALLDSLVTEGMLLPAQVEGLKEPAYLAAERLPDLERLRSGAAPRRTTLLTPFDGLIWDRARARTLFDYEVCFEAYVVPEKRRYGYYCLAILHQGRLVGRVDTKAQRAEGTLLARAIYLEPGVRPAKSLVNGLAGALADLARFLKLRAVQVGRSEPGELAGALQGALAERI